jgi:hypothetical protein
MCRTHMRCLIICHLWCSTSNFHSGFFLLGFEIIDLSMHIDSICMRLEITIVRYLGSEAAAQYFNGRPHNLMGLHHRFGPQQQ